MIHQMFLALTAQGAAANAWNPADKDADVALSNFDLTATVVAAQGMVRGVTSRTVGAGSYQFELTFTTDNAHLYGVANSTAALTNYPGSDANGWSHFPYASGYKYNANSGVLYGQPSSAVGDIMGCVLYQNGDLVFYRNGRFQGLAYTGLTGTMYPAWGPGTSSGTRSATIIPSGLTYPVAGVTDWAGSSTPTAVSAWNSSDKDADIFTYAGGTYCDLTSAGSSYGSIRATTGRASGSGVYQCEFITFGDTGHLVGMGNSSASLANFPGIDANGWGYYSINGDKYNATGASYGAGYSVGSPGITSGDVVGMVWDAGAGTLTFYKNGTSQGTAYTGLSGTMYPMWGPGTGGAGTRACYINTGQTPFIYPIGGATAWG